MKKKCSILFAILLCALLFLSACGKEWTCDSCGEDFKGDAYRGWDAETTYCEDCAIQYWNPFPISGYKKS